VTRALLSVALLAVLSIPTTGCARPDEDPSSRQVRLLVDPVDRDTAVFAMGCFWCAETAFEERDGIIAVVSGFAGGHVANPSYDQVTRGGTGHYEVVQVIYDADVLSYNHILYLFWRNVDPFDDGGQFCDRGLSYRPAIFADEEQQAGAEESLAQLEERFDPEIVVQILDAAPFYPAEEYHQDFYLKDPGRYYSYRRGCGRDARLREIWGSEKIDDVAHAPGY